MATAEINFVPLVNVIESLRVDNASNASEQTRRDSSRDTVLLDINVELVSIKDSILSTRDAIVSTLQSGFGQVQTQNTAAVTNTLKEQFNTHTSVLVDSFSSIKESITSIPQSFVSTGLSHPIISNAISRSFFIGVSYCLCHVSTSVRVVPVPRS